MFLTFSIPTQPLRERSLGRLRRCLFPSLSLVPLGSWNLEVNLWGFREKAFLVVASIPSIPSLEQIINDSIVQNQVAERVFNANLMLSSVILTCIIWVRP